MVGGLYIHFECISLVERTHITRTVLFWFLGIHLKFLLRQTYVDAPNVLVYHRQCTPHLSHFISEGVICKKASGRIIQLLPKIQAVPLANYAPPR
eukprot:GEMP01165232.1.p1 GENE.GEMP01165232.1~~GEMP01165232.1.p1  ORF type:complete len:105 (+),score=2.44 GEMP01165232.1:31-315(+)